MWSKTQIVLKEWKRIRGEDSTEQERQLGMKDVLQAAGKKSSGQASKERK